MIKVLLICGVSGSGKSYIEKMLKNMDYHKDPHIYFNKLDQVTTRPPRNQEEIDEKVYKFIDNERYDKISPHLIAKTEINGTYYGTINTIMESDYYTVVNTIIVNRLGWENVTNELIDLYGDEVEFFTLKIDTRFEDLVERKNRDIEFLKKEEKTLEGIYDFAIDNNIDNRVTEKDIIGVLKEYNFI